MATKVIGGRNFVVKPIGALQSFALQPLLAPAVGRALGIVLSLVGDEDGLSLDSLDIDELVKRPDVLKVLGADAGSILSSIRPADLLAVTRGLLVETTCDEMPLWPTGDDKKFNELFAGRTMELWMLLWFAVQENYPDFFRRGAGSGARSKAPAPSETSSTSPGAGPSTG